MANVGVTFDFKAMEAIIDIEVAKVSAPIARRLASRTFERAKQNVIKEVSRHPISEELESPTFNSKFIVGGDHPKSLFGFFGFQEGTHPVEELLEHIQEDFWNSCDVAKFVAHFSILLMCLLATDAAYPPGQHHNHAQ